MGGADVYIHDFETSTQVGGEWSAHLPPPRAPGRGSRYPFYGRQTGPQSPSGFLHHPNRTQAVEPLFSHNYWCWAEVVFLWRVTLQIQQLKTAMMCHWHLNTLYASGFEICFSSLRFSFEHPDISSCPSPIFYLCHRKFLWSFSMPLCLFCFRLHEASHTDLHYFISWLIFDIVVPRC
jgi:hypothetical protein